MSNLTHSPSITRDTPAAKRRRTLRQRFFAGPLPWLLPALIALGIMRVYPVLAQFQISLTDMRITSPNSYNFIGLSNYQFVLTDPLFIDSLGWTVLFVAIGVPLQFAAGFGLALLLNQPLVGRLVFRLAIMSGWVISGLIIGYMWRLILAENSAGVLNAWLGTIGISPQRFLSLPENARAALIVVDLWRSVAFSMVFMLGGLQTLPTEMMEAARVDGANLWQRLVKIIIPYLRPIIALNVIFIAIGTFNIYELIVALTGGGPARATQTIGYRMFETAFGGARLAGVSGDLGRGAAIGNIMFLIVMVFTILYLWVWVFRNEDSSQS